MQLGGRGNGQGLVAGDVDGGSYFHLAALEARGEQGAQCRFKGAQFVGKAEGQIQKAAIDRADLKAQTAVGLGLLTTLNGCAVLGSGVSGHAVNWHWTFDGCLQFPDYPGFVSSLRFTGKKCLQKPSQRPYRRAAQ
ncbi:hypothetical protein SDC9_196998 [bioreactor metagenome]|uniref:Uncharacterized protein n=1 Tax=bioreactor metagenome TaxID=1076179 RepID=A0A645IDI9_9ZZZZ